MTDAELRAIVRETVARHLTSARSVAPQPTLPAGAHRPPDAGAAWGGHPSHHLYLALVNATEACVIEPAVPCDHCGYCRSHGH